MKLNWGTGIFIFIILFVVAVAVFFFYTVSLRYDLVEEDYYPRELEYGKRMEQIDNTNSLEEKIRFETGRDEVTIFYPPVMLGDSIDGTVHIYRPSDARMDLTFNMVPDSLGAQVISSKGLVPGKYILKLNWKFDGLEYYQEEIYIR